MGGSIETVRGRQALKPREAPYWHLIRRGCHLGFRKLTVSSTGTWFARAMDHSGAYPYRSMGTFDNVPASERFDKARAAAEDWFVHINRGGTSEVATVKIACIRYVEHVRGLRGNGPADALEAKLQRWVYSDSRFSAIDLVKLTRPRVDQWRKTLAGTLVRVNYNRSKPLTRPRAASSVNRDITPIRSALNYAHDIGLVTTDAAWRTALRPTKNADGRRDVYLDREQRRSLIAEARPDAALFLRGLSLLPLRPGALAALNVAHFDKRLGVLTIGKDKAGRDRKIRLPDTTTAFLATQAKDKLPSAPLLCQADGRRWNKDAWKKPIKAAASDAKLPNTTTAYAMRHSTITDLVTGGLDLLSVAQISGTSVAMIERHYGHLNADRAAAALAQLAL
jgi:integrase